MKLVHCPANDLEYKLKKPQFTTTRKTFMRATHWVSPFQLIDITNTSPDNLAEIAVIRPFFSRKKESLPADFPAMVSSLKNSGSYEDWISVITDTGHWNSHTTCHIFH